MPVQFNMFSCINRDITIDYDTAYSIGMPYIMMKHFRACVSIQDGNTAKFSECYMFCTYIDGSGSDLIASTV